MRHPSLNIATLTVVVTLYGPGAARSQAAAEYPSRPVTIIVPAPPGGLADGLARALAAPLAKALKQAVVVDNKPGAAGVLATGFVAKAAPDGHTLLLSGDAHPVSGMLYKLPYDPIKDFVAVAPLATWPLVLIAAPGLDARTVPELVTLAKAKPGRLTVASTGTGSSSQLAAEVFKATAGVELTHIPYRGGAAALSDVMAGQVDVMLIGAGTALQHIRSGRAKALAVTSSERLPALPEVSTFSATFPKFEVLGWIGLFAPTGTPPAAVARLNTEVEKVMQTPELRSHLEAQAMSLRTGSPAQFALMVKSEALRYADIIKRLNIKVD